MASACEQKCRKQCAKPKPKPKPRSVSVPKKAGRGSWGYAWGFRQPDYRGAPTYCAATAAEAKQHVKQHKDTCTTWAKAGSCKEAKRAVEKALTREACGYPKRRRRSRS